ncbi:TPA: hypothetical protein HA251_05860 [Candidatus Woesearchaeota archaeon]|nr:hypothetical protein [Candidatus Woesearchaeota archaeon]
MYGEYRENAQGGEYFVLFKRDVKAERWKSYGEMRLYDALCTFGDLSSARNFAMREMPAQLGKRAPYSDADRALLHDETRPYLVAVKHCGKFSSSCMGETERLTTYDARRCSAGDVESTMESMLAESTTSKAFVGLELKLF